MNIILLLWNNGRQNLPIHFMPRGKSSFNLIPGQISGFPDDSVVKHLLANAVDKVLIPGPGRSLEKEKATHTRTLAWENPWTEEPGGLQSMGSQNELDTTERLNNRNKGRVHI